MLQRERAGDARRAGIERFIAGNYPALPSFWQGKPADRLARELVDNSDRPAGVAPDQAHSWLLVDGAGGIAGLLQLLEGYPTAASWYVGLLVLERGRRGRGEGSRVVRELQDEADRAGIAELRAAIDLANVAALRFWHRLGFVRIEKIVDRPLGFTLIELVDRRRDA